MAKAMSAGGRKASMQPRGGVKPGKAGKPMGRAPMRASSKSKPMIGKPKAKPMSGRPASPKPRPMPAPGFLGRPVLVRKPAGSQPRPVSPAPRPGMPSRAGGPLGPGSSNVELGRISFSSAQSVEKPVSSGVSQVSIGSKPKVGRVPRSIV